MDATEHRRMIPAAVSSCGDDVRANFITRACIHLFPAIGGFMLVSWLASRVANTADGLATQYAALAAYVVAGGIIFVSLLNIADRNFEGVISSAAIVTFAGITALTPVALAGAAILHDTSIVVRRFAPDKHVAAALEFIAPVALLFWYVLRLFMSTSRD